MRNLGSLIIIAVGAAILVFDYIYRAIRFSQTADRR
jgi:hypothetical protein